ncbi:hypothetical protein ACJMK2_004392 [Sinanodonta woodiana]|uniref:Uncharacterized protein n=1 Tax=Sinanodonta woodiana TaxID=1069815 RepID=A0ABD3Y2S3_SINWO
MAARQVRQECSICMDIYKSPKLLPCHHSFCYKCLDDYVRANLQNGRFDCPLCRKSAVLPKEGVLGFQTNFYVDMEETFTCDLCGPKSIAYGRCLDCEENLCQSCCHAHEKSKVSKHHKISNLGTLDPEMKGKIQQRIFCDEHPEEEIKLVCQTCNVLICVLCKAVSHENHASKTVATVAAEVKKKLEVTLEKCNERLKRLNVIAQKGQAFNRQITDEKTQAVAMIEEHRLKVLEAFNKEVSKMKDRVERCYIGEENKRFLSDVEKEIKLCSFGKEHVTKLLNEGAMTEIIKNGLDLENRLSEASARKDPNYETKLNKPLFSPAAVKAEELASLIGTIQDRDFGHRYQV